MENFIKYISRPDILVFLIPIVAILGYSVNKGLNNFYAHKERMIKMKAELNSSEHTEELA